MLRLYARVVLHRGTLKAEAAGLTTLDAPVARAEHRDATGSLDVVIVSYRCRDHLSRCLASVERYAPARTSVWVVDNDSRDGTVEMVRDRFPSVSLIESTENAGFARATNRGITAGSAAVRARTEPGHRAPRRHPLRTPPADGGAPRDRNRRPSSRAAGRHLRSRVASVVPDPARRTRAFQRHRQAARARPARPVPRAGGRARPGRRGQRRLHAHPPFRARAGRSPSTRATGCTWRISTSATGSGRRDG